MATQDETATPQVAPYNLCMREIHTIHCWSRWLELWERATTFEELIGLLHVGFNVDFERRTHNEQEHTFIDRLVFYLGMADGWRQAFDYPGEERDSSRLQLGERGQFVYKTTGKLRQMLAQKAFDMLAMNFFNWEIKVAGRHDSEYNNGWTEGVATERLLSALQQFFRVTRQPFSDSTEVFNLPRFYDTGHHEKRVVEFVLNLAKFVFLCKKEHGLGWTANAHDDRIYDRLDTAKPWVIELLAELRKLDVLRELLSDADEASLAKLREIAMRQELREGRHPVLKSRRVATLDEACLAGSPAAWILKQYEFERNAYKQLEEIMKAEWAQRRADEHLKRLTGNK